MPLLSKAGFRLGKLGTPGGVSASGSMHATFARALIAPCLAVILLVIFRDRFLGIDPARAMATLAGVTPGQWIAALVLCYLSYWSLGRYDAMCHRLLKTGISPMRAGRNGMAALAVSQTLGLGILTGAVARWRLLPSLGIGAALKLSTFVALSFMAVWAWLALGLSSVGLVPVGQVVPVGAGLLFVTLTGAVCALAVWPFGWPRRLRAHLRRRHWGLRSLCLLALFALLDMGAAAGVLAVLCDDALGLSFAQLAPVFILALGIGLLSSTPSGLGTFELTMLTLLPSEDPDLLIAAILGYRLIYFSLPATLGVIALTHPPLLNRNHQSPTIGWHDRASIGDLPLGLNQTMSLAPLAEAQLARQPGLGLLWSETDNCGAVIGAAGHQLVLLRDPLPLASAPTVLTALDKTAAQRGQSPCLYKCGARTAALARTRGYEVLRIAHEAVLNPQEYSLKSRSRRQLRRKLRHAAQAGITFELADPQRLPIELMTRVNTAWAEAHGGERGFSMGRFHPDLVVHQKTVLAWRKGALVGFVTFHTVEDEWTLDLLRPLPGGIDGTAHGMIDCALMAAKAAWVPRLSLAAAPLDHTGPIEPGDPPLARLQRRIARRSGGAGLARFKSMFDPDWEPLYLAAPSRWQVLRAGVEIAQAIADPPPFPRSDRT